MCSSPPCPWSFSEVPAAWKTAAALPEAETCTLSQGDFTGAAARLSLTGAPEERQSFDFISGAYLFTPSTADTNKLPSSNPLPPGSHDWWVIATLRARAVASELILHFFLFFFATSLLRRFVTPLQFSYRALSVYVLKISWFTELTEVPRWRMMHISTVSIEYYLGWAIDVVS